MTLDAPPWFEAVSPHLLRNKAVRSYLNQFNGKDWPEAIKLTLLHGILALHKQYPGQVFSVERLRGIVGAGQSSATIESALPELKEKLAGLKAQLEDVSDDITSSGQVGLVGLLARWLMEPSRHGGAIQGRVVLACLF